MNRYLLTVVLTGLVVGAPPSLAQPSFQGLGDLPGGPFESAAFGISADGTTVVGRGRSSVNGYQAFKWTQSGGMVGLGGLSSPLFSSEAFARAVLTYMEVAASSNKIPSVMPIMSSTSPMPRCRDTVSSPGSQRLQCVRWVCIA